MKKKYLFPILILLVVFVTSCNSSKKFINVDYQPTEETAIAMLKQSASTTRGTCVSCGCKADFFHCKCPTKKRLDCVLDNSLTVIKDIKPEAPKVGPVKDSIP